LSVAYESQIINQPITTISLAWSDAYAHTLECAKSRLNPESHWLVNGPFLLTERFCKKCLFSVTSLWSGADPARAGLTIGQTGQMPGASHFWGPRAWISKHSFTGFSYF